MKYEIAKKFLALRR